MKVVDTTRGTMRRTMRGTLRCENDFERVIDRLEEPCALGTWVGCRWGIENRHRQTH